MHHFCLVTVTVFPFLHLVDPVLGVLELPQKLLISDLQLLDDSLLLRVLAHLLINFFYECVIDLAVLPQFHELVILLVLLKHVVFDLHHDVEPHFFEFCLNLIVLFLKLIDVLVFGDNLTLGLGKFLLQVFKLTLVLDFQLGSLLVKCRFGEQLLVQLLLNDRCLLSTFLSLCKSFF